LCSGGGRREGLKEKEDGLEDLRLWRGRRRERTLTILDGLRGIHKNIFLSGFGVLSLDVLQVYFQLQFCSLAVRLVLKRGWVEE
jgi:hypothetical protein